MKNIFSCIWLFRRQNLKLNITKTRFSEQLGLRQFSDIISISIRYVDRVGFKFKDWKETQIECRRCKKKREIRVVSIGSQREEYIQRESSAASTEYFQKIK